MLTTLISPTDGSYYVDGIDAIKNPMVIKKKINIKIKELLKELKDIEAGTNDSTGDIQKSLMKAEKLRIAIIEKYVKYLGNTYQSLCLNKIQIIINELRYKLFTKINTNQNVIYIEFEENRKKGR